MKTTSTPKRLEIVDALRGFSLAGIVIVHIVEQYAGGPLPAEAMESARQGTADYVVDGFIQFFLRGKFFALFSLLFGWSFFIQFDNARKRNTDYRARYLWRIFLLFVIGYVHHCFYRGDILTIYAMLAPFLILFLPLSNKWLWAGIGIIFLGIPRIILFQTIGDGSIFGGPAMDFEGPEVQQYWQVLKYGTLPEVLYSNATDGFAMKMEFQLGIIYRFYLTFAFFLFGAWLGRIRYFDQFEKFKTASRWVLIGSTIGFFVFGALTAVSFMQMGQEFSFGSPWAAVGLHMADLLNLCLTLIILAGFVFIYHTRRGQRIFHTFKEYGRMALTNYVFQSIIGTSILFGWGLGQIGEWRNIHLFVFSLAIIALQIIVSKIWMKTFRYGPLEWVWRSLTYFKRI
jgi:uncharacterized protein